MMKPLNSQNGPNLIDVKNKKSWWKIIGLIAAAAVAVAVVVFAWARGAFLPQWIEWKEKKITITEDEKQDSPSEILLAQRKVSVQEQGKIVWETPEELCVQDVLWCDINHDEKEELMLLCWRIGRYGDARPFWVEKDEKTWSQHIYIYQWKEGEIHPIWMASDIGMDVKEICFDEKQRLMITETDGKQTFWDWVSWGLTRLK